MAGGAELRQDLALRLQLCDSEMGRPAAERRGFPEWSRDSRSVYFMEWGPEARLVRIEVGTGKVEEVRTLTEFPITGVTVCCRCLLDARRRADRAEEPLQQSQIYRIERDR